jgi:bifunctional non-homologous end joining protein LigD
MPRFAILRHETPPGYARPLHWDLMLEFDGALRTWALEEEPRLEAAIVAWPLPDHRLEYLTHQGPVAGNRGKVAQWDAGAFDVVRQSDDELVVRLEGEKLNALVTLSKRGDADQRCMAWFVSE